MQASGLRTSGSPRPGVLGRRMNATDPSHARTTFLCVYTCTCHVMSVKINMFYKKMHSPFVFHQYIVSGRSGVDYIDRGTFFFIATNSIRLSFPSIHCQWQ